MGLNFISCPSLARQSNFTTTAVFQSTLSAFSWVSCIALLSVLQRQRSLKEQAECSSSIREGVAIDLWFVKVDLDKRNVNEMIQNKDLLEWILQIAEVLDFYCKGEQTWLFCWRCVTVRFCTLGQWSKRSFGNVAGKGSILGLLFCLSSQREADLGCKPGLTRVFVDEDKVECSSLVL